VTGWLNGKVVRADWEPAFASGPPLRRRSVASETIFVALEEEEATLPYYEESTSTKPRFKLRQEVRVRILNGSIVEVRAPLEGGKVQATPLELIK
jgi:hypothetical protein